MGLRVLGLTVAPLKVAWQGAFGANRTRGSTAASGQVCSLVAWPCPIRSHGCELSVNVGHGGIGDTADGLVAETSKSFKHMG